MRVSGAIPATTLRDAHVVSLVVPRAEGEVQFVSRKGLHDCGAAFTYLCVCLVAFCTCLCISDQRMREALWFATKVVVALLLTCMSARNSVLACRVARNFVFRPVCNLEQISSSRSAAAQA